MRPIAFFLPTLVSLAFGNPIIVNETLRIREEETPLICNCSSATSRNCGRDGQCNAEETAAVFRKALKEVHDVMSVLLTFPRDSRRRPIRDQLCRDLATAQTFADIPFLFEFEDWEPACVRGGSYGNPDARYSCLLAPKELENGTLPKEKLSGMLDRVHRYLQCPGAPPTVENDSFACRHGDFCNDEEPVVPELQTETREAVGQDETPEDRTLFLVYILVPLLVASLLILLIALCFCYRRSKWNHVYKVTESAEGRKQLEVVQSDKPKKATQV